MDAIDAIERQSTDMDEPRPGSNSNPVDLDQTASLDPDTKIVLRYADIVELSAPTNSAMHEKRFVVDYIDEQGAVLADVDTGEMHDIFFTELGTLRDESITEIRILSRADPPGYAATNGLITGAWVDVHIGGDMPTTITGRISAVEEDMIEVAPFPKGEVFYVDFAYKGIPKNTPFEDFVVRDIPAAAAAAIQAELGTTVAAAEGQEGQEELKLTPGEIPEIQGPPITVNSEMVLNIPTEYVEDPAPDANYTNAFVIDDLVFSDTVETVSRLVEISAQDNVYTIEAQLHSILDELVAAVPEEHRTGRTMARIHSKVERFRELRESFSKFDEAGDIIGVRIPSASPLGDAMAHKARDVHWMVPVCAGRKWIFDVDEAHDISGDATLSASTSAATVAEMCNIYDYSLNVAHDYARRTRATAAAILSVNDPIPTEMQNCFAPIYAKDRLETVLENVDILTSTVVSKGTLSRAKFVLNTFDAAPEILHRDTTNRRKYIRIPVSEGDQLYIKAVVALSQNAVQFSRCWLPGTDIMMRSDLATNTVYTFQELAKEVPTLINQRRKEWSNRSHRIQPNLTSRAVGLTEPDAYANFVASVAPEISSVIPRIAATYSLTSIVNELEVLQVYREDFTKAIRTIAQTRVAECSKLLRENILSAREQFSRIATTVSLHSTPVFANSIGQILGTVEKVADAFAADDSAMLLLRDMYDSPNSCGLRVLHAVVRRANVALRLPAEMLGELAQSYAVVSPKEYDCARHILAKRYASEPDLVADNDRAAYFDPDLDPTPYNLTERYPRPGGSDAEYADFLSKALVRYHDAPASSATRAAAAMVAQKRYIIDGEYASVAMQDSAASKNADTKTGTTRYFIRKNDRWVHDPSVDAMAFALSGALFCDIAAKCVRAGVTNDCVSAEEAHASSIRSARAELDKRFDARAQDNRAEHDALVELSLANLVKSRAIALATTRAQNNFAYKLGKVVSVRTDADLTLQVICNSILSQIDITKRHTDIVRFVENSAFCRMPVLTVPGLEEDPHWIYGAETNSKILPSFIYELARAALANEYSAELERVCADRGVVVESDVVDKFSGYVIKRLDDAVEDEYNAEGFRVLTRAIMPVSDDEINLLLENTVPTPEDSALKVLQHIVLILCESLRANPAVLCETATRVAGFAAASLILSQDKYTAKVAAMPPADGKRMASYAAYFAKTAFYCSVAGMVVALQTAVPPLQLGARVPGCMPSTSGFPLDADEADLSTITFVVCSARSARAARAGGEWTWLSTLKPGAAESVVQSIISTYILAGNDEVADLYAVKRAYIATRPATVSVIHIWPHFTPPIIALSVIATMAPRSDDVLAAFVRAIRSGASEQREIHSMIFQRATICAYALIEAIHTITGSAGSSIRISPDKMTTSCCSDTTQLSTLAYFASRDPRIEQYIAELVSIDHVLRDERDCASLPILYNALAARPLEIPVATTGYTRNAYAAILRYCRLDSNRPIPLPLQFVMQERPAGYNTKWGFDKKIEFLQERLGTITSKDAAGLLRAVGETTMIPVFSTSGSVKSRYDAFITMLRRLDIAEESEGAEGVIPHDLRRLIRATMATAEKQGPSVERSVELDALSDYLVKANLELRTDIIDFVKRFGTLTGRVAQENFMHYLDTVDEWNTGSSVEKTDPVEKTGPVEKAPKKIEKTGAIDIGALFSGARFLKFDTVELCTSIPTAAANNARARAAPKHWDLAPKHVDDLARYSAELNEELNRASADVLIPVLRAIPARLHSLVEFTEAIPVNTPTISADGREMHILFNIPTTKLLLGWCWRTALHAYITSATDPEFVPSTITPSISVRAVRIDMDVEVLDDTAAATLNTRAMLVRHMAIFVAALTTASNVRKRAAIINYGAIEADTRRVFAIDEKRITDRLAGDRGETSVQRVLKSLRLGEWAAGAQSAVYKYDKAAYDNARFALAEYDEATAAEIEADADLAAEITFADMVSGRDADAFDAEEAGDEEFRDAANEADREYNMRNLRSDYYDGGGDDDYGGDNDYDYDE